MMSIPKNKIILTAAIAFLAIATVFIILRGDEDTWLCQNGQWIAHGHPSDQKPTSDCGQEAIEVTSPAPYAKISSPVKITGQARGNWFFEASFPVILTAEDGTVVAASHVTAKGNWMTQNFVPFEASLDFKKPVGVSRGFLILKKDNPSGLPQNDASFKIPVIFQ